MLTPTDLDPSKRVHHLTRIFAILSWFFENDSRLLINFTILLLS